MLSLVSVPSPRTAALPERRSADGEGVSCPTSAPPRLLGDRGPRHDGPTLLCLGGVHGNEPAGVLALQKVFQQLEADQVALRGRFVGLSGNRSALSVNQRFVDFDLNRAFKPERLSRVRAAAADEVLSAEETELRELDALLSELISEAPDRVHVLDLHSTSGSGAPFSVMDDTLANRAFAFALPVPHVLGLEEEVAGTVTSHTQRLGCVATAFEAGQHADPASVERAEAAIWISLESSGLLLPGQRREVEAARRRLVAEAAGLPRVVEVRHRHALQADHRFRMEPGFRNFDPVRLGQLLATESGRPVTSDRDARILMPLYQGKGDDGFFIAREVKPVWLEISAVLRRAGLHRWMHWLPGVTKHPQRKDTLVVDRRRARWLALQIFHLLGYRREQRDEQTLVMTRRDRG